MDITAANLQIFFTGLNASFTQAYSQAETWADKIAMTVPSSTELETYAWRDQIPAFRKWIGSRLVHNIPLRSRSVVNEDYELTLTIPRNKFLDDKQGLFSMEAMDLGMRAAKLHDTNIANLILSNPIGFDGVPFFSPSHLTNLDAATSALQSNSLNLALSPTNYSAARAAMRSFKDRAGIPFGCRPSMLVVPPSLEEAGLNILNADFFAPSLFGGGATVGASDNKNLLKGSAELLVIDELESQPKTWYLLDNKGMVKPFLKQVRQEASFQFLNNPTDPNLFFNREFIYGGDLRAGYDVTVWFKALRSVGP